MMMMMEEEPSAVGNRANRSEAGTHAKTRTEVTTQGDTETRDSREDVCFRKIQSYIQEAVG